MLENMPAAVRKFHSVTALGPSVGQNIDRPVFLFFLRTEEVGGKTLALISVGCADDHFDVLHVFLLLPGSCLNAPPTVFFTARRRNLTARRRCLIRRISPFYSA